MSHPHPPSGHESRYRSIFEFVPVSIWEEDWREVMDLIKALRRQGVTDFAAYFDAHPEIVEQALGSVRILDINSATLDIFKARDKAEITASLQTVFSADTLPGFRRELVALANGQRLFETEMGMRRLDGEPVHVLLRIQFPDLDGDSGMTFVSLMDITESRRARQRLALRDFALNQTLEAIYLIDEQARFIDANDTACRMLGYTREELLARSILDIRPGFTLEQWRADWSLIRRQGALLLETEHQHRDGRRIPVEISANYFEYRGQCYDLALARDISERRCHELENKRQTQALQTSQEQLLRAQTIANIGSWEVNLATQRLDWSDQVFRIFGIAREQFAGTEEAFFALVHPEDRALLLQQRAQWLARGGELDVEHRIVRPDGTIRWVREQARVIDGPDGTPAFTSGTVQDITERKHADERLLQYRQLVESSEDLIAVIGADYRYVLVNRTYAVRHGLDVTGIEGRYLWEVLPASFFEQTVRPRFERCLAGESLSFETERDYEQIGRRSVLSRYVPIHGPDHQVTHVGMIITDITERKRLEEQLRQSQRLESIGQLTGGIAHDFNNLLTVILGNAELLQDAADPNPRQQPLIEMIGTAAQRGAELTRRLLAFARKQALNPESVDVNQLILGMDPLLHRTIGEHIEIDFSPRAASWPVSIDATQLESALLNLALNARDAMTGGGTLSIETRNTELDRNYAGRHPEVRAGQYVLIAVSDTGSGIAPEHLEHVFEPFYTTKETGKGTGLGLSMVYGFVKQSDGHVEIYSEPGQGTTVKLYLPRLLDPTATPAPQATETEPTIHGGNETILLVEDDVLVRRYAEGQLRGLGYRVLSAADGPAALAILRARDDIDLLFTDIVMPGGMSGRDLAEAARTGRPDLKVLYTSGYTENAVVHQGRLDPGVQLLGKPYRRAELANALREALDLLP